MTSQVGRRTVLLCLVFVKQAGTVSCSFVIEAHRQPLARVAGKLPLLPSSPSQAPPPPPQQAEPPRQGTAVGTTADTLLINRVLLFAASDWMYRAFIKLFRIVYQTF